MSEQITIDAGVMQPRPRDGASRTCAECGAGFRRHPSESVKQFKKRHYCGRSCASIVSNRERERPPAPRESKVCAYCGTPFDQRPGEWANTWAIRKYCTPECGYADRSNNANYETKSDWDTLAAMTDPYIQRIFRRILVERQQRQEQSA